MEKKAGISWETKKKLLVALGVLLILAMGVFLVNRAMLALLDRAFQPSVPESFEDPQVWQTLEAAGLTIPEGARFLYGEYYGWQDASLTVALELRCPVSGEQLSEYLKTVFLKEPKLWEETELLIGYHETLLSRVPDVLGTFSLRREECVVRIDYSAPLDGSVKLLLHCVID